MRLSEHHLRLAVWSHAEAAADASRRAATAVQLFHEQRRATAALQAEVGALPPAFRPVAGLVPIDWMYSRALTEH